MGEAVFGGAVDDGAPVVAVGVDGAAVVGAAVEMGGLSSLLIAPYTVSFKSVIEGIAKDPS